MRLTAILFVLAVSGAASAQKTGTRLDNARGSVEMASKVDASTAVAATNAFWRCTAQRRTNGMRKALDLPLRSAEQIKAIMRFTEDYDACLGTQTEFDTLASNGVLVAGSAAEFFVTTVFKRTDLRPLAGMTDEVLEKTDYRPRNVFEDLGLCIVRRSPERARALTGTRVNSLEEAASFKAIVPDIGPCVTQGAEVTLNKPNIRALLAYALFRSASKLEAAGA